MKRLVWIAALILLPVCACAHRPPEAQVPETPIAPSDDPAMEKRREQQHPKYQPKEYPAPKRPVTAEEIHTEYEWPMEDCVRLARREIWIGMSYYMLVYLYGEPDQTNVSNYGAGDEHQWCWMNRTPSCFYDKDGDDKIDAYN